jgi:hypothetical protein
MGEPNFSTTRTQYCFDTTNIKYKSRSDLFDIQRKWNTFEDVENYNDIIYQRFQIGYRDKLYYQFKSRQEYNDYRAGQELHVLKYAKTLPATTFTSISSLPMPDVVVQREPPHYVVGLPCSSTPSLPTPLASETTTNRAELAMYTYVSTYNATHHYQYNFVTNEEQIAFNRIQRQILACQAKALVKFSPDQIPDLQLWYDGTDPNGDGTLPADGALINTWVNKVAANTEYNAVAQSTNGNVPASYSLEKKALFFNNNNQYNTGYTGAPTRETMFVVFNNPDATSGTKQFFIGGETGGRGLGCGYTLVGANSCGTLNIEVAWQTETPVGSYPSGTTAMTTTIVNTDSTSIALNGGTTYSATNGLPYTSTTPMFLGGISIPVNKYMFTGYAMEIIIYNYNISIGQTHQVEGYLAWKWGFQASLPPTHPFSKRPPVVYE